MFATEKINTDLSNIERSSSVRPQSTGRPLTDLSSPVQLLDHRAVEWKHVRRARYWMDQRFEYSYPGPIRDLRQRLIIIPPDQYGDQQLCGYSLHPSTPFAASKEESDPYGNRVIRIYIPEINERVTFDMKVVIERDFDNEYPVYLSDQAAQAYYDSTHLTTVDAQIEAHSRRFQADYAEPEAFGNAVNTWVYQTMRYGRGATTVHTTAAEALTIGQGLCQDYAHIMIAICRAAGIATRYVSGHLLGEGRSHAWVEILIPDSAATFRAVAFDPTNHRRTTPAYLTIATGRDYTDVSPTSGTFTAPYPGQLHTTKRAGVTHLELLYNA